MLSKVSKVKGVGMIKSVKEQLEKVENGLFVWQSLCKKLSIHSNDIVLLIPNNSKEFSYFSILYSQPFIQKNEGDVHLLTTDKVVLKAAKYLNIGLENASLITEDECASILALYNLYMFTNRLIILSPYLPVGRTGYHLIENEMLDVKEYISIGLLQNREFHREPLVTYVGDDEDLIDFFTMQGEGEKH